MVRVRDYTLAEAGRIGAAIGAALMPGDVVLLSGELGAGKTTLARAMLKARGLASEAPSPTFAIVQPYAPPETRLPVMHVDLYRIENAEEIDELGLDEARGDSLLLIEWPERAPGRWPDALALSLDFAPDGGRRLTAKIPSAWEGRWSLK